MGAAARALTDGLIRYFHLPEDRRDVLFYGVTCLLLDLLGLVAIVLAGFLVGLPGLTLVAAATSGLFRSFTGGAHFYSPWLCTAASAAIAALLGVAAAALRGLPTTQLTLGLALVVAASAVAFHRYAPVDSPAKPISPAKRAKLRRAAWLVLVAWTGAAGIFLATGDAGLVVASALGLLWQSWTLTPGGARLYRFIDQASGHEGRLESEREAEKT